MRIHRAGSGRLGTRYNYPHHPPVLRTRRQMTRDRLFRAAWVLLFLASLGFLVAVLLGLDTLAMVARASRLAELWGAGQ